MVHCSTKAKNKSTREQPQIYTCFLVLVLTVPLSPINWLLAHRQTFYFTQAGFQAEQFYPKIV